jgi:hypothetical protein
LRATLCGRVGNVEQPYISPFSLRVKPIFHDRRI